jgi:alpha-beta hydrolase superfamily lysophospholipase
VDSIETTLAKFPPETRALVERLVGRDHDLIGDLGRTTLLLHPAVRPTAVVLFHGLSASPAQFSRFAHELYEHGHNVIVPRLPRHGHRDRLSTALASLTADDLRATAMESVDLASRLGERVVVAGFSLGGLLATWVAQHQSLHRAVAIAPFLGVSMVPNRWMSPLAELLLRLPNRFPWWDPIARERQLPEHGYPRYATHAIGHAYRLARDVLDHAAGHPPLTTDFVFVTNRREAAVNNRAVLRVIEHLRAHRATRVEHVELTDLPLSHDVIEPLRHPNLADRVYPRLLSLIEGS